MTTTTTPSTGPTEWSRDLTSRAERYAAGKALRSQTPRSSHAQWAPDPERPDPISILEESNKTRLENLRACHRSGLDVERGSTKRFSWLSNKRKFRGHGVRKIRHASLCSWPPRARDVPNRERNTGKWQQTAPQKKRHRPLLPRSLQPTI